MPGTEKVWQDADPFFLTIKSYGDYIKLNIRHLIHGKGEIRIYKHL